MAYNVLTGSVNYLTSTGSLTIAGTFVGDGSDLIKTRGINTVEADSAADNRLITFTSTGGSVVRGEQNLLFDGQELRVAGRVSSSAEVSASAFYGDGAGLTNVTSTPSPSGPANAVQFKDDNATGGDADFTWNKNTNLVTVLGDVTASLNVSASAFYGDGSKLTGINAGSGGGIFTEINGSNAYTTSSVKIGSSGTPAANLHVSGTTYLSGGVIFRRVVVAAHHTASANEYVLGVNTAAAISILLDATAFADGQTLVIKDEVGSASINNITLLASGAQKIDADYTSVLIESPFGALSLYSDTSNWFIF